MVNKIKGNFKIYLLVISMIIILFGLSLVTFNRLYQNEVKANAYKTLKSESNYNISAFQQKISSEIAMLNTLKIGVIEMNRNKKEIFDFIKKFAEESVFSYVSIEDANGNSYTSDGSIRNIANRKFFKETINGGVKISKPTDSLRDDSSYVVLSVPVYENGLKVGMIYGSYEYAKWEEELRSNVFIDNAAFRIIDDEGDIIITTSLRDKENNIKNIFDPLYKVTTMEGEYEKGIKENLKKGQSGACYLQAVGTEMYAYYEPLGINDWYVFSGVSAEYLNYNSIDVIRKIDSTIVMLIVTMVGLFAWLIRFNNNQNRETHEIKKKLNLITSKIQGGVIVNALEEGLPIIYVNEGACHLTGYSNEEFISKNNDEFIYEEDRNMYNNTIYNVVKSNISKYEMEYRIKNKDGNLIWVLERGSIVKDEKGKKTLHTVIIDIQKQKDIEKELVVKEQLYEVAVKISGLSMFEYDVVKKEISVYQNSTENNGVNLRETYSLKEAIDSLTISSKYRNILEECYKKIDEGEQTSEAITKEKDENGEELVKCTKLISVINNGKPVRAIGVVTDITTLYRLEKDREINEILQSDIQLNFKASLSKNKVVYGAPKWLEAHGIKVGINYDEMVLKITGYVHDEDINQLINGVNSNKLLELFSDGVLNSTIEYRRLLDSEDYIWVEAKVKMFKESDTDEIMAIGYIRNINERKLKQLKLLNKAERDGLTGVYNRETAENMITEHLKDNTTKMNISAFMILDVDYFKGVNDKLGHSAGDKLLKKITDTVKTVFKKDDIIGRIGGDEFIIFVENANNEKTIMIKARNLIKMLSYCHEENGEKIMVSISMGITFSSLEGSTYKDLYENADKALYKAKENGRNGYSIFNREGRDYKMNTNADYVDPVTGGYNFEKFKIIAKKLLIDNPRDKFILCYSDIKNFKAINYMHGFEKGDEILKKYSDYLEFKNVIAFARVNVDNFVAINRYEEKELELEKVKEIMGTSGYVTEVFNLNFSVKQTLGIYLTEGDNQSKSLEEMIDAANLAQKQLSINQKTGMAVYDDSIRDVMIENQFMENRMKNALNKGEFIVYIQPKYDIKINKIATAEALVRWNDPERGIIPPISFIPLFEKNGFIKHIDNYMFQQSCILLNKWIKAGKEPVPISVNVSKPQLNNPKMLEDYLNMKNKYNIPDGLLEVEFTESMVVENVEKLTEALVFFKKNGIQTSIDDFGSGYSSLNLLKNLSVDILKLDKQFFDDDEYQNRGKVIIKNIVSMAKELNMKTVAEGIEYKEQVEFLQSINCDMIQGYVFEKPIPISTFEEKYIK
ncbi:MAG: EAL domain-containing protein [Clostridium sp.]|uniref:EAL domain-containing protein n=1 Tax=Clostridium sp. TaxID=1506 RepID=UPI0030688FE9